MLRQARLVALLAFASAIAACSRGAASGGGLSELEQDSGVTWTAEPDPRFGTTAYLFPASPPPVVLSADGSPSAAAVAFLSAYPSVFSLTDPAHELVAEDEGRKDGLAFASFTEVLGSVPVYGTRLTVVFDREGRVAFVVSAALPSAAAVTSSPSLSSSQAAALAEKDLLGRYPGASTQAIASSPSLVLYPLSSTPRLAYVTSVALEGASVSMSYVVDASTGEVLEAASELRFLDAGSVPASGKGELGGTRHFSASPPTEPLGRYTMQAGATSLVSAISVRSFAASNALVSSDTPTSWDTVGENPGSAVDAYFNLGVADDWWHEQGRKGYDNQGGSVAILVHDSELVPGPTGMTPCVENAFWYQGTFHVCPSDDVTPLFATHAASVDLAVMAHEYQHAVTGTALGLHGTGEAGALDESLGDVFGQLIDHDEDVQEAHCITAATWLPARPERPHAGLRNLVDPHQSAARAQPDNMGDSLYACPSGEDNGCVHVRDGVPNKAWSLMTFGGEDHTGSKLRVSPSLAMGWEASETLYINLIQTKPLPPVSTFHSLGYALDGLARALYGSHSSPREAAACAFYAVGVYSSHEMTALAVDPCKCGNPSATCDAGAPDAAADVVTRGAGLRCFGTVDAGAVQCASYYFPYATTAPSCADFTSGVITSNLEVTQCPHESLIYGCCTSQHGAERSQACYYDDTVDEGPVFKVLCEEGMGTWTWGFAGLPEIGGKEPSQDGGTEADASVDAGSDASTDAEPAHC